VWLVVRNYELFTNGFEMSILTQRADFIGRTGKNSRGVSGRATFATPSPCSTDLIGKNVLHVGDA
jgi:hypothetical protein